MAQEVFDYLGHGRFEQQLLSDIVVGHLEELVDGFLAMALPQSAQCLRAHMPAPGQAFEIEETIDSIQIGIARASPASAARTK